MYLKTHTVAEKRSSSAQIMLINKDIEIIKDSIIEIKKDQHEQKAMMKDLRESADEIYVRKLEFAPVQKILYAMVGLVLTGVVSALMGLIIMK